MARDYHGRDPGERWPRGAPDSQGGQFAPGVSGTAAWAQTLSDAIGAGVRKVTARRLVRHILARRGQSTTVRLRGDDRDLEVTSATAPVIEGEGWVELHGMSGMLARVRAESTVAVIGGGPSRHLDEPAGDAPEPSGEDSLEAVRDVEARLHDGEGMQARLNGEWVDLASVEQTGRAFRVSWVNGTATTLSGPDSAIRVRPSGRPHQAPEGGRPGGVGDTDEITGRTISTWNEQDGDWRTSQAHSLDNMGDLIGTWIRRGDQVEARLAGEPWVQIHAVLTSDNPDTPNTAYLYAERADGGRYLYATIDLDTPLAVRIREGSGILEPPPTGRRSWALAPFAPGWIPPHWTRGGDPSDSYIDVDMPDVMARAVERGRNRIQVWMPEEYGRSAGHTPGWWDVERAEQEFSGNWRVSIRNADGSHNTFIAPNSTMEWRVLPGGGAGRREAVPLAPPDATSQVITGNLSVLTAHLEAVRDTPGGSVALQRGQAVQVLYGGDWWAITDWFTNPDGAVRVQVASGMGGRTWFDVGRLNDPNFDLPFVHMLGGDEDDDANRGTYNEEIEDAIRVVLDTADHHGVTGQAIREELGETYGAFVGPDWTDVDATDILSDWLTEFHSAIDRGDQEGANHAADFLAQYTGLNAVFPGGESQRPGYEATAAHLAARRYGDPAFLQVLTSDGWEPVEAAALVSDGTVDITTRRGNGRRRRWTLTQPETIRWLPLPVQQRSSMLTDSGGGGSIEQPPDPLALFLHPAPDELPGGAPNIASMLEGLAAQRGGQWRGIPVNPELQRRVEAVWNWTDPRTGMRAEVTQVELSTNAMYVSGQILDDGGRYVGRFQRAIDADRHIHHSLFSMDSGVQGGGFTTRWFEQALDGYHQEGFQRVTVGANLDVGGYTWTHWFDFASSGEASRFLQRIEDAAVDRNWHITDETRAEMNAIRQRLANGEHVTAREISLIGHHQRWTGFGTDEPQDSGFHTPYRPDGSPMEMWVGKAVMLGSSWSGELRLPWRGSNAA